MSMLQKDPYNFNALPLNVQGKTYYTGFIRYTSNFYIYSLYEDKERTILTDLLMKVYQIKFWVTHDGVMNEIYYNETCSKLGVAPEFITYIQLNDKILLITRNYGYGTLTQLYKSASSECKEEIKLKLKDILHTMYANNISHNDLHSNNFLYNLGSNGIELKVIDFEYTTTLTEKKGNGIYRIKMIELDFYLDV